ncbi:MAG: outer membrane beta-barrel protein, partial [Vicingaceae bacterium]
FKIVSVALLMAAFTQTSKAQFKFSAGLELGFALESNYGLMYGASLGGEMPIGDGNMGITAQAGYILAPIDLGNTFENISSSFIPMQLGYKYYFDSNESGPYVHGQLGFHLYKLSYEYEYETFDFDPVTFQFVTKTETRSFSDSSTNLSYAVGGGYLINENIDLSLRYNIVAASGGSFNYLGVRAAYNF